jgi:uncharacterized protein YukE
MKKICILFIILLGVSVLTAVSEEAQRPDEKQDLSGLVKNLEKQNAELRLHLRILENELKHSQTMQSKSIDSLMGLLQENQRKILETSDTLSKTYMEISTVKTKSEAQGEWFGSSIAQNRIQMFVIFIILLIIFSILYYLLSRNLDKNAILMHNKFQAAYEDFDDNIKSASALLNKHIKETRESLDKEVKLTHEELDKQIIARRVEVNKQLEETSIVMDKKIEENKIVLDKHFEETKNNLANEIKKANENFEKQISSLKKTFDDHLNSRYESICSEFSKKTETLSNGIEKLKDELKELKSPE